MNASIVVSLLTAVLPLGDAYIASSGGTCAGTLTTSACPLGHVQLKGLYNPELDQPFGVDDRDVNLKVTNPTGTSIGTVVVQIGGSGTGSGEANTYGAVRFLEPIVDAGYQLVQIMWIGGGATDNGCWEGSAAATAFGGDGIPDGPLGCGARFATLTRALAADSRYHRAGTPFIGVGFSGGSSALAYACSRFGGCDPITGWFDGIVLLSGPPISDLERGCAGATVPGWLSTDCPALRLVSPSGGCVHTPTGVSGPFVARTWSTQIDWCSSQAGSSDPGIGGMAYSSIFGGFAARRYPYTVVRAGYARADSSEAVPLGRWITHQMHGANGSYEELISQAGTDHTLLDYSDGADLAKVATIGGTYLGTTYAAITVTRPATAATWTPEDIPGARLWLTTHATPHLWTEDYAAQVLTHPAVDGDVVRVVDDPVRGHVIGGATTSGTTLSSGSGANSFIRFNRADSDWMTVKDTGARALAFMHEKSWTLLAHVGVASDGLAETILDNSVATTSNHGMQLVRTSGNKLQLQIMRGVPGTSTFNCTTTANLTASMGIVPVYAIVSITSGNTGQARIKIGSQAEETCAQSNAPSSGSNPGQVLWIGRASGGGQPADLQLQDLVLVNGVVGEADLAAWTAWNPSRTSSSLKRYVGPDRGFFNFASRFYDYTRVDGLYIDTGGTTHVAASGDAIALVRSLTDPAGELGREGSQSTAANRPTWRGASSGGEWDGTNDNLVLTQTADAGALTWLVIVSNRKSSTGTHVLAPGGRVLVTGPSYTGNSTVMANHTVPLAYMTTHPGAGSTCVSDLLHQSLGELNALLVRRDGATWTQSLLRSVGGVASVYNECSATNTAAMHFTSHGSPAIAGWDADGFVKVAAEWHVSLTDAELQQVWDYACTRYGGC